MIEHARALLLPTALFALATGCDRKEESHGTAGSDPGAPPDPVESTTAAVSELLVDAGPDSGEASAGDAGFAVTTVVKRANAGVVEGIAMARCRREHRCGNVGAGKDHASLEDCRKQIAHDWREELNRYECPEGIDARELNQCVAAIEDEDCKHPFDKLERLVACRSSSICLTRR